MTQGRQITAAEAEGQPMEKTLPSNWYSDPDHHAAECRAIFMREWYCTGRVEELDAAGGHMVVDVMGQSILILRKPDGALRAFYNVCRHRGAELCTARHLEERAGRAPLKGGVAGSMIRCAYHSWAYDLDGRLVAAPHLVEGEHIRKADFSLHKVGVDSWGGFLFVHLSPEGAGTLAEQLGGAPERVARYPLANLRIGAEITYEIEANWKILAENYNECYHCGGVHPELCAIVPAFRANGGSGLDWENGVPHREGADTFTATGTTPRSSFPGLDAAEQQNHKGELIYPNLFVSLARDHVACFLLTPKSPTATTIRCLFLFAQDEMARPGFDPADAVEFWDLVNRQDWSVCERVQRGIRNRVHDHGYYAPMEDWNLDIRQYVISRLEAARG